MNIHNLLKEKIAFRNISDGSEIGLTSWYLIVYPINFQGGYIAGFLPPSNSRKIAPHTHTSWICSVGDFFLRIFTMGKLPFLHWLVPSASESGPQANPSCGTFAHNSSFATQADLHVGSKAQIVGLQRAIELNGLQVLVLEEEEGHGDREAKRGGMVHVSWGVEVGICMKNPLGLGFGVYIRGWNHTQNENDLVVQGYFGGVYYPVI